MSWARTIVGAAWLALGAQAMAAPGAPDTWWRDVRLLADDRFDGRLTGSAGYDAAARLVVARLRAEGLKPAGSRGYFQDIAFTEQVIDPAPSRVTMIDGETRHALELGADLVLNARIPQAAAVRAPLVFIGYGLHLPKLGADDFTDPALKGAIGIVVVGGPADLPGTAKAYSRSAETWPQAERAGAAGLLYILLPGSSDIPWARQAGLALQPGLYLDDPSLREPRRPMFAALLNNDRGETLFAKSGHRLADIIAAASRHEPLPHFALNLSVDASVAVRARQVTSANIVARLPGSDSRLGAEQIVVSAHLDHLAGGAPIDGDHIYNGAMDNAAGVATLLAVAHDVRAHPPRRSLLFVVFTGEEEGLLGSRYFAQRPTVPATSIVANVNVDMPLPLFPPHDLLLFGGADSDIGDLAAPLAGKQGFSIIPDPNPDRNLFSRTDQFNFIRAGIPAVTASFGAKPGTREAEILADWVRTRYHAPSDDGNGPHDARGAAAYNRFVRDLVVALADRDARPGWRPDSVTTFVGER